jgi:hypothetical protein
MDLFKSKGIMTEIKLEFKTNPKDDKLIDMYSSGNFVMSMIDGCQTPDGQKMIAVLAEEMAEEMDRRIVENLMKACGVVEEEKDDLSEYEKELRFKNGI